MAESLVNRWALANTPRVLSVGYTRQRLLLLSKRDDYMHMMRGRLTYTRNLSAPLKAIHCQNCLRSTNCVQNYCRTRIKKHKALLNPNFPCDVAGPAYDARRGDRTNRWQRPTTQGHKGEAPTHAQRHPPAASGPGREATSSIWTGWGADIA